MATTVDYIDFVMDSLSHVRAELSYKKMFGEYCVYANGKPVLLVCDNMVYAKIEPCTEQFRDRLPTGVPYSGAKLRYVLDMEDWELVQQVVELLERHTPLKLPKPRQSKKGRS